MGGNFRLCAVDQKRSFFPRAVLFLDLLPFQGPFPLTGALTGKPPYGKAPYGEASYEKAPYELQESLREATGRDFTRIGREFPLVCRRPKKAVFSSGALTGRPPYGKVCYGQTALREGPLRGGFLREGPPRVTGKLMGSYGEGLYQNWAGISACAPQQKKVVFSWGLCRFWTFCPFRDLSPLQGPIRADRFLTRRPPTNYRKAYGKLRGGTLPELGGNFRLCAIDQKRSFCPRAVPFLDLLPFKEPFPLTGALTSRPPDGKAPYGEASYEKAPYELQESLREATGRDFTRIGREFPLVCRRPKKAVFS